MAHRKQTRVEAIEQAAKVAERFIYGPEWPRPLNMFQTRQNDVAGRIAAAIRRLVAKVSANEVDL